MGYYLNDLTVLRGSPSSRLGSARRFYYEGLSLLEGDWESNSESSPTPTEVGGYLNASWKDIYLDKIYVSISNPSFGVVVGEISRQVTIRSTYGVVKTLNSISIPAGFEWDVAPVLPLSVNPSTEYLYTLKATSDGPAVLTEGQIVFTFSDQTLTIGNIQAIRSVLIPFRPMNNVSEELEWKTVIHQKIDGTEQRSGVRKYPRQIFTVELETGQGFEEARFNNLLIYWQGKSLIFPLWEQSMFLTAAATAGASVLQVDDTRYSDVRDGGLIALAQGDEAFETMEVISHTQTTITLNGTIANSYNAADEILPARVCTTEDEIGGNRWKTAITRTNLILTSVDNITDIASTAAFSSLEGKVFLDDPNELDETTPSRHFVKVLYLDGKTGRQGRIEVWPYGRKGFQKGWNTLDRKELWELRQLFYALEGRRVSFFFPTANKDLIPDSNLGAGAITMTVSNVGFSAYAGGSNPYNRVRVVKTDGTTIIRTIVDVDNVDGATEQITVNSAWGEAVTLAQIERVELIQLCRLDTDRVRIKHIQGNGQAKVFVPIVNTIT